MQLKKISIFIIIFAIIISINGISASDCNIDNLNAINSSNYEFESLESNFDNLELQEYEFSYFETAVDDFDSDEQLSSMSDSENLELYNSELKNPMALVENNSDVMLLNSESNYSKVVYVGQNNAGDGNGSLENPFSTLDLACNSINGESKVLLNIFNGTYLLGSELKFNTSDLTIQGISGDVIIKAENPTTRGYYRAFELIDSNGNFTMNNIIFDASDYTAGILIASPSDSPAKQKMRGFFFPFYGNPNVVIFNNCTFKGKSASINGWNYNSLFYNCIFDGFTTVFYDSSSDDLNGSPTFKNCIFLDIGKIQRYYLPHLMNCSFIDCWFGQNELPSYLYVTATAPTGHRLPNTLLPIYSYAVFSVFENYLGNDQYEIVGKLTWNGTDDQEGMENFRPMTVTLNSATGDINQTATLINGTFRAIYTSSNSTHKVTATLDNEEIELEFNTVNITTNPVSIYYGDDQNITFNFTQPVTANVTVTVSNGNYNKSERVEIIGKDSLVYIVLDTLKSGSYHVKISLGENNLFGFNTTTLTVLKHDAYAFNTEIIDNGDIKVGDNVTVKVELPEDVSGNITIYVNDDPVVTKDALQNNEINVTALVAGDNIIIVTYNGDDKYDVKSTEPQVITAYKVVLPDGENKLDVKESTSPTVSINLPEDAEGNLTVTVGTKTYTQKLENGSATVNINDLPAGTYKAIVTYAGDGKYDEITTNINITVKEEAKTNTDTNTNVIVKEEKTNTNANSNSQKKTTPVSTKITAKNKKFKAKTKVKKYTITLKAGKKFVKKVTVTLKIKGKTYKAKTNAKGKATFKIKKLTKKGKHKAVIKFKGNKNYKASSKKVKITIK